MFCVALWNGRDPILKERLFGLTNSEGNHGEDVKEYYFYLDSTPTHSYMKYLYKYPQRANSPIAIWSRPTGGARERNGIRTARHRRLQRRPLFRRLRRICQGRSGRHADPDLGAQPRAGGGADHVLPTFWFRNTWSWETGRTQAGSAPGRATQRSWRLTRSSATTLLQCEALRSCCSRKTSRMPAVSGVNRTRRPTSKTRSTNT